MMLNSWILRSFFISILATSLNNTVYAVDAKLRVGLVYPQSGPAAGIGRELRSGIDLALEKHLEQMPKLQGLISIYDADDRASLKQAKQVSQQLIQKQRVHVILGSINNLLNSVIAENAENQRRLSFLPNASDDDITNNSSFSFRVDYSEAELSKGLVDFSLKELPSKSIAIIIDSDSLYSKNIAQKFKAVFPASTDSKVEIYDWKRVSSTQIKSSDLIFLPMFPDSANAFLRKFNATLKNKKILATDSLLKNEFLDSSSKADYLLFFARGLSELSAEDSVADFRQAYESKYKKAPSNIALRGYVAMDALISVYQKANSNRSEALARQIQSGAPLPTMLKTLRFTKEKSIVQPLEFLRFESGKLNPIAN